MPFALRLALVPVLALLIGGAAYLMAVRGPAILVDLAGAVTACF